MITDLDIYRAASVLIREHGEDAAFAAGLKADKFLEEANMDGMRLWREVLKAVIELQRTVPDQGELKH